MQNLVLTVHPDEIHNTALPDLFELSFLSQEQRDKVTWFSKTLHAKPKMNIDGLKIHLKIERYPEDYVSWEFRDRALITDQETRVLHGRTLLNGQHLRLVETRHTGICYSDNIPWDMMLLIEYLKHVLNPVYQSLIIDPHDFEVQNMNIILQNPFFTTSKDLEVKTGTLMHGEMTQLLEGWKKVERAVFNCYPGMDFVYNKSIPGNYLTFHYAQWMTRRNLLNLSCRGLELYNTHFTSHDFNAFILNWLGGRNKKFEYLFVRGRYRANPEEEEETIGFDRLDLDVITAGFVTENYRPKDGWQTLETEQDHNIDFYGGLDVKRESDGKVATIQISHNHLSSNVPVTHFLFVVWKGGRRRR